MKLVRCSFTLWLVCACVLVTGFIRIELAPTKDFPDAR